MRWRRDVGLACALALTATVASAQTSNPGPSTAEPASLPPLTSEEIDRAYKALDAFLAAAKEERHTVEPAARAELSSLQLPVTNQLSALRYCASQMRFANAADHSISDVARSKAGFVHAETSYDSGALIPYGDLFPTVRSPPFFDRRAGASVKGTTYIASDDSGCAVLTTGDAQAERSVDAWLSDQASGWTLLGDKNGWRVYRVQNPNIWQRDLRLIRARPSPEARKAAIDAVDMVVMTGLP